jgi:hypothetical protein
MIQSSYAAGSGGHSRTKSLKTKNYASEDDCTNECPNKYFEPAAAFNQVAKKVASNAAERGSDYSRDLQLCSILVCHHRQSSSASRLTAGAFGFFTFTQSGDWPVEVLTRIGSQTTLKSNDLEPTRPMLSAIWIVTLCRPRGSSASSTNTPDGVGLACASIRLVRSIPKRPYLTRRVLTSILALAAA